MPRAICCLLSLLLLTSLAFPAAAQPRRETEPSRPAAADRRVDLRPKFEKGQQLRYKMELNNISAPVGRGGRTAPADEMRSLVELGLLLRTVEVDDQGLATVDIVLESLKLRVQSPEMTAEYDSAAGGSKDDMIAMVLSPLVGTKMTAKIDREGNISGISGGEALAMLGQVGAPGAGGPPLQLFSSIFSIKKGSGLAEIGESWENQDVIESPLLGRFRMTTRHTLARMQGQDAVVQLRGQTQRDSQAGGGRVTIKDSSYSGQYLWDTRAGALKQMETTMTVNAVTDTGEEKVESRNESTVKVTRVK
jgi:hypothetical protein